MGEKRGVEGKKRVVCNIALGEGGVRGVRKREERKRTHERPQAKTQPENESRGKRVPE